MSDLRSKLIRLAFENPDMRAPLLDVLGKQAKVFPNEKALERYLRSHPNADKTKHRVEEAEVRKPKEEDGDGDTKPKSEKPAESSSWGSKLKSFVSALTGVPKAIQTALTGASESVQRIVIDPEHRKTGLKAMGAAVKKSPGKISAQIYKGAKGEVHELAHAGEALKKALGKPPKTWDAEDKAAVYSVAVYAAVGVLAATGGGALVAAGALGKSFAAHVAFKAMHGMLDRGFVHFEAGEVGLHATHHIKHVMEHLSRMASTPDMEKKLIDYLTVAVGNVLSDGVSDSDMEAILKGEKVDPSTLGSPKKGKTASNVWPEFLSYADAMTWIEARGKALGMSKMQYRSTPEFRALYPYLEKLHKSVGTDVRDRKLDSFSKSGLQVGDIVEYRAVGAFLTEMHITGKIILRAGSPYVLLDPNPHNHKKTVPWNPQWRHVR